MRWRLWVHPVLVCTAYYGSLIPGSIWMHDYAWDWMLWSHDSHPPPVAGGSNGTAALCLAVYAFWLLVWRLGTLRQSWVFYEYCWLCNFTLVASAIALKTHRPYLALTYCTVVSVDQFLWYVDLLYYCAIGRWQRRLRQSKKNERPRHRRRFLVGVCQYVFDEQVSWHTRVTCTHHLWTIPFVVWSVLHQNDYDNASLIILEEPHGFWAQWCLLFGLSGLATTVHVLVSRAWIPLYDHCEDAITTTNPGDSSNTASPSSSVSSTKKYLNVNLGHALWRDVTLPFLQITHPHAVVYMPRLLLRWQCLNGIFAFVLLWTLTALLPPNPTAAMSLIL